MAKEKASKNPGSKNLDIRVTELENNLQDLTKTVHDLLESMRSIPCDCPPNCRDSHTPKKGKAK